MRKQDIINGSFGIITLWGGYYGKYLQMQVIEKKNPYEWYMGHLTDLMWPATTVFLAAIAGSYSIHSDNDFRIANTEKKKEILKTLDAMVLGTAGTIVAGCTFVEYLDSTVGVAFDWKDVFAYTLGAGAAYGVYKFSKLFDRNDVLMRNL